jgi:hypothetical protein
MSKKLFALITMMCLLPAVAFAWSLNTWVKSAGGNLVVRGGAPQTSVNGSVFKSYTTSQAFNVTVNANTGYTISNLTYNGVSQTLPVANPTSYAVSGPASQSVYATFAPQQLSVTASAGAGGTVSPSSVSGIYYGTKLYSPLRITFTPSSGFNVVNITGVPTGATVSSGLPAPANTQVIVTFPTNFTFTSGVTLAGTFQGPPVAKTGAPQTVLPGTSVTLNGSASTGTITTYTWAQTSGPATVTLTPSGSNATFTPTVVGTYQFSLTVTGGSIATTTVTVTNSLAAAVRNACIVCHNTQNVGVVNGQNVVFNNWSSSNLNQAGVNGRICYDCHVGANSGGHPGSVGNNCIGCHNLALPNHNGNVADNNNGVRAIVQEFSKWSHHVTGVTLDNSHCAACHLEGTVVGGQIVIDRAYHMADGNTHLRNADTDADMVWNSAAPNHSNMDSFCMSCHDANGATSPVSAQIQAVINTNGIAAAGKTASASNPFGDTISNRYDKLQRPAVTNVDDQFNTANNSHHGVKGPRYTGRTRLAGPRQIANAAAFANNSTALLKGVRKTMFDAGVMNNLYTPLENAGGEVAPRTGAADLGDDSTLHCGDCHTVGQWKVGSSETANGSPTSAAIGAHGSNNEYLLRNSIGTDERHTQNAFVVSSGTVIYTNPNGAFLVCYNCHSYTKYGSIYSGTGLNVGQDRQPHAGEYDSAGRCNGVGNTIPFNGYTTGKATDGTQFASRFMGTAPGFTMPTVITGPPTPLQYTSPAPYAGEQPADFGNIYGIQCLNCHNSGAGNAYGGIHGSANNTNTTLATVDPSVTGGAYIDGMGNTTKVERFLPGLGNAMHVPGTLGGFTGGTVAFKNGSTASGGTYTTGAISNDTNWEQKHWQQTASTNFNLTTGAVTGTLTSAGAGCYTLGAATAATSRLEGPSVTGAGGPATELLDTWGGCEDHGAKQGNGDHGFAKRIVRPVTY